MHKKKNRTNVVKSVEVELNITCVPYLITLILGILRIIGIISWPWWIICMPSIISFALSIVFVLFVIYNLL